MDVDVRFMDGIGGKKAKVNEERTWDLELGTWDMEEGMWGDWVVRW